MIFPFVIVAWSVLCLAFAATQPGFSVAAFIAWGLGCLVAMVVGGWDRA